MIGVINPFAVISDRCVDLAMRDDPEYSRIVSIHGQSGCGKTSVIAMLTQIFRQDAENNVILFRFLGTSPKSTYIRDVLKVC